MKKPLFYAAISSLLVTSNTGCAAFSEYCHAIEKMDMHHAEAHWEPEPTHPPVRSIATTRLLQSVYTLL